MQSDNPANEVIITPTFVPAAFFTYDAIEFDYDTTLFTMLTNAGDGKLHLRAKLNSTGKIIDSVVKATAPNGLVAQVTLHIRPQTVAAPVVVGTPSIRIGQKRRRLQIVYDHPEFTDWSTITWYRGSAPGDKAVQVARHHAQQPIQELPAVRGRYRPIPDRGDHAPVRVQRCRRQFDRGDEPPRAIVAADVPNPNVISTNFANITWTGHTLNQRDVWYADTIKPTDINQTWVPSTGSAVGLCAWVTEMARSACRA